MPSEKIDKRSQRQKFKETAREIGADESEERFNATLRKIGKKPPAPEKGSGKKKPAK